MPHFWAEEQSYLSRNLNCLEMRAMFLALKLFVPHLRGYHVLVNTESTMVVSFIIPQDGLGLLPLFGLAQKMVFSSCLYQVF